jgi:hypothetical protein
MSTIEQAAEVDGDKLMQFVFRAVDEVGATLNAALVVLGDKLGLYRALAYAGPLAPAELAERTGTAERYVREWLNAQAAGGYVEYDPASGRYTLPPEQAVALTDPDSRWARCSIPRGSSRRPAREPGWGGTSTDPTCMTAVSGSSVRATTPAWSRDGYPHLTVSSANWRRGRLSPTSAAATARPRS